jgi:hypothetical protein
MATAAPAADCRRRAVLPAALSKTSAAFLFLSVVVVGAVLIEDLKDGNSRVTWLDREPYAYWKGNPSVCDTTGVGQV